MTVPAANVRLTNGRLPDGRLVNIDVSDGLITTVTDVGSAPEPDKEMTVHDLGGWLVLPAMAEPHAHLDKALTADAVPNPTGDLPGAIEAWIAATQRGVITVESTTERAALAMEQLLVHGVTAVRSHVNVTPTVGGDNVRAVRAAADRFAGLLDVQIVALTGTPTVGVDGAPMRRALVEAIEAGADLVGGCPHLEVSGPALIDLALTAGSEAGIGLDLHVDETLDPTVITLRDLARAVIDRGFEHTVTASHCVSLGVQTADVQAAVSAEVAEAQISVVPLPQTNLFLQGRDHPTSTPRGLTAIKALQHAGVTVAAGADNVQDPFNLVGRSDPLETAALLVMAGHLLPDVAYDMVSNQPRSAMGLHTVAIQSGSPADLVAIDATSIRSAIADAPMSRRVFRAGHLVASADQSTTIHRP